LSVDLGPRLGPERDILHVEPGKHALEPARDPPVGLPEQLHHRRHEDHADERGIKEDRRGEADSEQPSIVLGYGATPEPAIRRGIAIVGEALAVAQ
jgi:hypothetical protein